MKVVVYQQRDTSEGIKLKVLRLSCLSFEDINELTLVFDVADGKQNEDSSARSTTGVIIQG